MYAAIRQGKAKTGMAEEVARRIREGAIPNISDVPGFQRLSAKRAGYRTAATHPLQTCGPGR